MIVKLSNWLLSTVRAYPPDSPAALIGTSPVSTQQRVTLVYASYDPSTNSISVVWQFTNLRSSALNSAPVISLIRLDTGSTLVNTNFTIPYSYTWGQVALVETITLIGAV